jgi:LysR family hydrogen peroxide-inducible transcriptional activator
MSITQLEYVLAVNKHRHFNRAAQDCHVTQPTLSTQLQKLEEALGVVLFDRSKSPVIPTLEGERLIAQSQLVVREYQRLFAIAKEQDKDIIAGPFKLAVIPTMAPYLVPLFVEAFARKYPKVDLTIEEAKTQDILDMLKRDELDAALLATPLKDDQIIERVLFYEPFHLFVSPRHKLSGKQKVKEQDLADGDIWLLTEGHCFREQVLKICSFKGRGKHGNLEFESGNLETLKNLVSRGDGYTMLPYLAVAGLPPHQKKLVRDFASPIPTREVSLVHARSFQKERIIIALENEILANLPKEVLSHKADRGHEVVPI